jgi:hypothetical protein
MIDQKDGLKFRGKFIVEVIRDGKVIDREEIQNIVVNTGIQHIQDSGIIGTTWYVGLLGNTSPSATTTLNDVAASEVTAYSEGTRQTWTKARTNQTVSNSGNVANFTISGDATVVYGAFIATSSGKGATAGTLLAAKQFGVSRSLNTSDVLAITYEITGTSS